MFLKNWPLAYIADDDSIYKAPLYGLMNTLWLVVSVPLTNKLPLIFTLPVNWEPNSSDFTKNPLSGATDAVTLPLAILLISNANADSGISNNPAPLPLNKPLPEGMNILPLTFIEPVNCEPLFNASTLNP